MEHYPLAITFPAITRKRDQAMQPNTLTGMSGGKMYRFDAEKTGCPCEPASWSHTVTGPAGASMGTNSLSGQSVILMPFTPGTYTITFTLKVCDKVVTQSFTLTIN
jgi:hypothetical protein